MRIYLAGDPGGTFARLDYLAQYVFNRLDSFAYAKTAVDFARRAPVGANVLIDSGAFTAAAGNGVISIPEYVAFTQRYQEEFDKKLGEIRFMNLDVIGDQKASWRNFDVLYQGHGIPVVPVVTNPCTVEDIHRACEYDYFALGGLVPMSREEKRMMAYLDWVFGVIRKRVEKIDKLPRVHLFGITQTPILMRYPAFSCDSTSWLAHFRFGPSKEAKQIGFDDLPKWKDHKNAALIVAKKCIDDTQQLEQQLTNIWKSRGVQFGDVRTYSYR